VSTLVRRLNRPIVALVAVGVIAAVPRFWHLGYPQTRIFDEYYYSKSACIFLGYSNERCDINSSDERYWREKGATPARGCIRRWANGRSQPVSRVRDGCRMATAAIGEASVVLVAGIAQLLWAT
jgi:hypothetical protein